MQESDWKSKNQGFLKKVPRLEVKIKGENIFISNNSEYCGVLIFEGKPKFVLPKVMNDQIEEKNRKNILLKIVPSLLRYSRFARCQPVIQEAERANYSSYIGDVGDAFLNIILKQQISDLMETIQQYSKPNFYSKNEQSTVLKGKVNFSKTILANKGIQGRFDVSTPNLGYQHHYFRIIRVGLLSLSDLIGSLRDELLQEKFAFCLDLTASWPDEVELAVKESRMLLSGHRLNSSSIMEIFEPWASWLAHLMLSLDQYFDTDMEHGPPLPGFVVNLNYVLEIILNRAVATFGRVARSSASFFENPGDSQIRFLNFSELTSLPISEQTSLSISSCFNRDELGKVFCPDLVAIVENQNDRELWIIDAKHFPLLSQIEKNNTDDSDSAHAVIRSSAIYQILAYGYTIPEILKQTQKLEVSKVRIGLIGLSKTLASELKIASRLVVCESIPLEKGEIRRNEFPNVLIIGMSFADWLIELSTRDEAEVLTELGNSIFTQMQKNW